MSGKKLAIAGKSDVGAAPVRAAETNIGAVALGGFVKFD
jgi:hypothetical protein